MDMAERSPLVRHAAVVIADRGVCAALDELVDGRHACLGRSEVKGRDAALAALVYVAPVLDEEPDEPSFPVVGGDVERREALLVERCHIETRVAVEPVNGLLFVEHGCVVDAGVAVDVLGVPIEAQAVDDVHDFGATARRSEDREGAPDTVPKRQTRTIVKEEPENVIRAVERGSRDQRRRLL